MMKRIEKFEFAILLAMTIPSYAIATGNNADGNAPVRKFETYADRASKFLAQARSTVASDCELKTPQSKGKRDSQAVFEGSENQRLVYDDTSGDCKLGAGERIISYSFASNDYKEKIDANSGNFVLHTLDSITIQTTEGVLTCSRNSPNCVSASQKSGTDSLLKASTTDPCSISNSLANQKKYGCKKAKQVNEYAEAGTQVIGAVTNQMIAAQNANTLNTLSNSSKVSDANRMVADTAQRTANQQTTMATTRGIAAILQTAQLKKYKKNANAIQALIDTNSADQAVAQGLIPAGKVDDYNSMSPKDKLVYLNRVKAEQLSAADTAKGGLVASVTSIAASTANAVNSAKIAQDQNEYANKMDDIANQQQALLQLSQVQVTPAAVATFAPYTYNNTTNVNNGTTDNTNGTSGDDEPALAGPSGVQGPAIDGAAPNEVAGPAPSALKAAGGDGGKPAAGGGGGGGGGGAAGGAPALGQEDRAGGSTLVMNGKNENYDSIGKSKSGAGGASGATTNAGGGDGLDLNSMLAKFLPGAGGGEEEANNGILDYAKREPSRAPANEAPAEDMILDRGADLFQRVSATYRDKLEKKEVGI